MKMNKKIILKTIFFYLIALIASYLIFVLSVCAMALIGDVEGFYIIGPLYYVFPALATYGYNMFLIKKAQKLLFIKRMFWLVTISANTLVPFMFYTLMRFEGQNICSYLLELVIITFVAMQPMLVGGAFSFLDLFVKEKANGKLTLKSYRAVKITFYVIMSVVLYVCSTATLIVVIFSKYFLQFLVF